MEVENKAYQNYNHLPAVTGLNSKKYVLLVSVALKLYNALSRELICMGVYCIPVWYIGSCRHTHRSRLSNIKQFPIITFYVHDRWFDHASGTTLHNDDSIYMGQGFQIR